MMLSVPLALAALLLQFSGSVRLNQISSNIFFSRAGTRNPE